MKKIELPELEVWYKTNFLSPEEAEYFYKLFETTVEICIPILLDLPSSPVKLAIAIGSGSTWPELILILKSSEKACEDKSEMIRMIIW